MEGGVGVWGVRGGIVDGEKKMGRRMWKWKREVRNGESERGCEENDGNG